MAKLESTIIANLVFYKYILYSIIFLNDWVVAELCNIFFQLQTLYVLFERVSDYLV